jgi:2-hydroxycyclohexanecarboxyl-CoA dehydrogenase
MPDLQGKTAVITGGASGIGRATVERLVRGGASVRLLDINGPLAEQTARELSGEGPPIVTMTVDIADDDALTRAAQGLVQSNERIDMLINAAGWDGRSEPFLGGACDQWSRVIDINLRGPMRLTQLLLPRMTAAGGAIVNIASDAGRVGQAGHTVYAAAKGGLIAFTKSLAREVARYRIRVNCIAPGPIDTPLLRAAMKPGMVDAMLKIVPLKRLGEPAELADAILFLAGDSASYITGQVLSVDGGLTMCG